MPCTDNFCYDIGEEMRRIRDEFERGCANSECTDLLLPDERKLFKEYIGNEFLDRRAMELARCFVQNVLRVKRAKAVKQFALLTHHNLTGRVNPERNMLSCITSCEKIGINAVTSSARFMGSFATVLKCNSSMFNMETIKRLLNDADWRFTATFNNVQQEAINDLLEIFHNYIVGVSCGNPVRTWSPNVMYTYGLYASQCPKTLKRDFCTVLEKVPFAQGQESIKDFLRRGKMTPELFISVIGQIALTLELLQQRYGFVHFDLHTDNIVMRPVYDQSGNGIKWSYMMYGNEFCMKNIQFLATLIDYGFSCFSTSMKDTGELSLQSKFVGMGKFQKYGIMDFMIPGHDMFVLLNNIRLIVQSTLDTSSKYFLMDPYGQENNVAILSFIDTVFQEVFQTPEVFLANTTGSPQNYRTYNVLLCKGAGLCPLAFLDKIRSSGIVKRTLRLDKVPWTVAPRSGYVPYVCKQKIPDFLADIMPNWKNIITENQFWQPISIIPEKDLSDAVNTMLDLIRNKKVLQEFDYRPLMLSGGVISEEAINFYDRLLLNKQGLYYGYFQNTLLFYNTMVSFLETYYYMYHVRDKVYIDRFIQLNNSVTTLLSIVQQEGFVSRFASMVRFGQTIVNMKKSQQKKFCCVATKQTLGDMSQKAIFQSQTKPPQVPADQDQSTTCGCKKRQYKLQVQQTPRSTIQQQRAGKQQLQLKTQKPKQAPQQQAKKPTGQQQTKPTPPTPPLPPIWQQSKPVRQQQTKAIQAPVFQQVRKQAQVVIAPQQQPILGRVQQKKQGQTAVPPPSQQKKQGQIPPPPPQQRKQGQAAVVPQPFMF